MTTPVFTPIENTNSIEELQPSLSFPIQFVQTVSFAGMYWALNYASQYVRPDSLTAVFYAYAGVIITTLFSNLAAIYVATMTVHTGMNWVVGLFYQYHTSNALSCFLGIYEMGFIILNLVWAGSTSFIGYYMAFQMWNYIVAIEKKNITLKPDEGIKYLTLGIEMSIAAWIAGLALGEQATRTIFFFDIYPAALTTTGESMMFDLAYHSFSSLVVYIAMSAISLGGYWIGFGWMDN